MTDGQGAPEAGDDELASLDRRADELMFQLKARGGSIPFTAVRVESLIDFLFPEGSPARHEFEVHFRKQQIEIVEMALAQFARAATIQASRGGNGHAPRLR